MPVVFIAVALLGLHFSNKCPYAYGYSSLTTPKLNESQIADNFTSSNMLALVVPAGDYEKEAALEDLHFDTVVTAEYKLKMSAAASGSERGDRPVIFAEGGFDDGAAVTSTATEESAVGLTPLDSGLSQAYDDSTARLPWYERITAPISGGIIEQRHVSIPDDG